MTISFGNINGAVSSNVYRAQDKPWFVLGHGLVLMYIALGVIMSSLYMFFLHRENQRRDRGEGDEVIGDDTDPELEARAAKNGRYKTLAEAKRDKGDEWSGYRYTL
ncbi:hypothetical protein AX16_008137 [Volvariella volvacea WC 439]|nr:hypothetical protein AX16_008137 [Volvariella volvacea WC 439]